MPISRIGLVYIAPLVPPTQYGVRVHDSDVSVPTAPGVGSASADIAWVSEAYDSFTEALYAYCRSLVREPAAAADAVRDTFVVTAFRLDDLPGEGLFRPWLYAVARNECLRAISDGQAAAAVDFLPNEARTDSQPPAQLPSGEEAAPAAVAGTGPGASDDTSPDLMAGDSENERALLRAALGGLDPADRDLMVMAWHGLDVTECAFVLGVSRDAAFKDFSRARDLVEQCAGALVVARSVPRACGPLSAMLEGWDGRLTPALSPGLRQHVDRCDICASARRGGPGPAALQLFPDAMRTMAVTAETSQLTQWVTARLRDQVLAAAFDQELESFEHRAMVVRRAGPFRDDGFPVALRPAGLTAGRKRRSPMFLALAGTGGTGLAAVIALAALSLSGNHSTGILQAWVGLAHPTVTASSGGASASAAPGESPSQGGTASASQSPTPAATTATPSAATPGSKPSATTSASAKPSAQPSRTTPSGGPASSAPTTAAAVQAGLSISATSLTLQEHRGAYGGTLTLTNPTGSAINWSTSIPDGSHLAIWGSSSAKLRPGQKATLYIYLQGRSGRGDGNSQPATAVVTINPGNIQVSVTIP
ncbi:MAG: sigW 2 [Actinomycetia bacterium]|nr:sigW 2 [Actinomycetes bacterium]